MNDHSHLLILPQYLGPNPEEVLSEYYDCRAGCVRTLYVSSSFPAPESFPLRTQSVFEKKWKDVLEPFGNFVSALGGTTGEAACLMACFRCFAYLGTGVLDATYQSLQ